MDNNNMVPEGNGKMREHYSRIWTAFGLLGFIVVLACGNREEEMTKSYINQMLGGAIISAGCTFLAFIPIIGWIAVWVWVIYYIVCAIIALVNAINDKPINFFILNLFHFFK